MNSRERVIAALRHTQPDRVPYYVGLTSPMYEKMKACTGDPDIHLKIRGDIVMEEPDFGWDYSPAGYPKGFVRDPFGVVWNRTGCDPDIGVIDGAVIPDIENITYRFPEPNEKAVRDCAEHLLANADGKFTVSGLGFSMFERAWTLCTMPEVLMAMITAPDALDDLLDRILAFDLRVVEILDEYPIDCIRFGDDWGQQRGLIMGPAHWRRFIKPRMAKLYARAKQSGKFVLQHSCGDIREIMSDLIEIGLDCYETFQPEIYEFDWFKTNYGDKLSILGGVSTQQCLPCDTPGQVREKTRELIRVVGKNGGLIAGPTHGVPGDVPPENLMAMMDVFLNG